MSAQSRKKIDKTVECNQKFFELWKDADPVIPDFFYYFQFGNSLLQLLNSSTYERFNLKIKTQNVTRALLCLSP